MKNQDYWTKRKANLIYEQMDKAEKQADKFDKVYKESKAYLDKQINKVFDKFQRDYGLSERDARHVLKNMKDQKDLNELRKVLEARPDDPNIQRLLADLDSPAYAYRMKRLERLNDDLDRMRESIYRSEKKGSDAFYSDLMKDSYYKATFDFQQQTGLAYSFSYLPETEIKRLQGLKWTGEAYSDRIWSNTGALASSVKDELLVSLMTGRSVRDTSQAIAERFEVGGGGGVATDALGAVEQPRVHRNGGTVVGEGSFVVLVDVVLLEQIEVAVGRFAAIHLLNFVAQKASIEAYEISFGDFTNQCGKVLVFDIGVGIKL